MDDERKKKLEEKRRAVELRVKEADRIVDDVLDGKSVPCPTCGQPLTFTDPHITCPNGCIKIYRCVRLGEPPSRGK